MKKLIILLLVVSLNGFAQKKSASSRFDDPVIIEETGVFLLPQTNNDDLFSKSYWSNYYKNIFVSDSESGGSIKLFSKDVYIKPFFPEGEKNDSGKNRTVTDKWIFLLVKDVDLNGNGKINETDPVSLYVIDLNGKNLKRITDKKEKVKDFFVNEKNNLLLVKLQKDVNRDNKLNSRDGNYYAIYNYSTLAHIKDIK